MMNENSLLDEKILIQLTKAIRLLTEEGYNNKTIKPMQNIVDRLKKILNVIKVEPKPMSIVEVTAPGPTPNVIGITDLLNKAIEKLKELGGCK